MAGKRTVVGQVEEEKNTAEVPPRPETAVSFHKSYLPDVEKR